MNYNTDGFFGGMFRNIGMKIKTLAGILCCIGIVSSIILGFRWWFSTSDFYGILVGLLIMVIGGFLSWISAFTLYGFGQLIHNSDILVDKIQSNYNNNARYSYGENQDENDPVKKFLYTKYVFCDACGGKNVSTKDTCSNCGARLRKNG